jgi:hypothetical protein
MHAISQFCLAYAKVVTPLRVELERSMLRRMDGRVISGRDWNSGSLEWSEAGADFMLFLDILCFSLIEWKQNTTFTPSV